MESEQPELDSLRKRIVDRDDLLHLAVQANASVDILSTRRESTFEVDPLAAAIDLHLQIAEEEERWSVRGQAYQHAAVILALSREIEKRFPHLSAVPGNPNTWYAKASEDYCGPGLVRDLTAEMIAEHGGIRSLRLSGNYQGALDRAGRPPEEFAGTGVEMYRGMFEYEYTVACLEGGSAKLARGYLRESDAYWAGHDRAQHWVSARGRHELAQGLLDIHDGRLDEALVHLGESRKYISATVDDGTTSTAERLSMALSFAECSAATWSTTKPAGAVLDACTDAFDHFERIRGRWGIVARSRSPLAAVLRMVLGDIARLVARIPGATAGRLGLRIALAAKQSGFAELIRTERMLLDADIGILLEEVLLLEQKLQRTSSSDPQHAADEEHLVKLRTELEFAASPLLADIVLPRHVDIDPIIEASRRRITLDFVQLPFSDGSEAWFRTTIDGPDSITFEQIQMGPGYTTLFEDAGWSSRYPGGILDRLDDQRAGASDGWSKAAGEFLPPSLLARLREATRDHPVELLISPHMQLCRIPWNALIIDEAPRTRLVERAVIAQIPMLSTLTAVPPSPAKGPALVWLADEDESSARTVADDSRTSEQRVWNLPADILVAECAVPPIQHAPRHGSLEHNLKSADWGFVHVACHGAGDGLGQYIEVPTELTAARAFGLRWPADVLLAACHVGRFSDSGDGEVLGFVVAAMAGGARCVVAGLHFVSDRGAGEIGRHLIANLDGNTRLDHALRTAQLAFIDGGTASDDLFSWALLAAFVR